MRKLTFEVPDNIDSGKVNLVAELLGCQIEEFINGRHTNFRGCGIEQEEPQLEAGTINGV